MGTDSPLDPERHCCAEHPRLPGVLCGRHKGHDKTPGDTWHRQRGADGGATWQSDIEILSALVREWQAEPVDQNEVREWERHETTKRLAAALRAYQAAATEATIAFYREPEPACDAHLSRAAMLDTAAIEIRSALAGHIVHGSVPAQGIREIAAHSKEPRCAWLMRVADDIEARLRGENPPIPEVK